MVAMAVIYDLVHELPRFPSMLSGLVAAVVGLQVVTAFDLARHNVTSWPLVVVSLVTILLSLRTHIHPVLVLFGGALIGAAS